jgi:hypothetical protein
VAIQKRNNGKRKKRKRKKRSGRLVERSKRKGSKEE